MTEKNKTAEQAANDISCEANSQVLSHCVIALKQHIEEKLKERGSINSIFEEKVGELYGKDPLMDCNSHKAYVNSGLIDGLQMQGLRSFARIYPKIDKVPSVKDKSLSYAFHIDIATHADSSISYDSDSFISENCGRFAVGHDSGHIVINLDSLIKDATIWGNTNSNVPRHYESDFFSYIQSDLRDFCLLDLSGTMNLDKAFNDYKVKGKIKLEDLDALDKIRKVFDKSAELYHSSQKYSMSHVILALTNVINAELLKKPDKLRKKLTDLRKKVADCKARKLKFAEHELTNEIKNINIELNSWNEVPRVSIHLIVREHYGDLTIDCYNRRDEMNNKDFYCFEITIKMFSKEERDGVCEKLCKAIGCLYYGYDSIIKRYKNNNEIGHHIGTVTEMQEKFGLNKEEIDAFTEKLFDLRKENFVAKQESIKTDEKLKARLSSYIS